MITANYGDASLLPGVLGDWFAFLGSKPRQAIVLDNGSNAATREATCACFKDGLIDKLLLIAPDDSDVGKHQLESVPTETHVVREPQRLDLGRRCPASPFRAEAARRVMAGAPGGLRVERGRVCGARREPALLAAPATRSPSCRTPSRACRNTMPKSPAQLDGTDANRGEWSHSGVEGGAMGA